MIAPYGTWASPMTAAMVAAQGVRLGAVAVDGDDIYWLEGRPAEGGRNVLVRRTPDGRTRDVTPQPFNVRTRVHEYGGGAFVVSHGLAWFSSFADQRVYRIDCRDEHAVPAALTPEGKWFYADACVDLARRRLICVREDHSAGGEPVNAVVALAFDGSSGSGDVLAEGYDFYSTPRITADGAGLAWISWRHPNMPWDGTELWAAEIDGDGRLTASRRVAGGPDESIYQPGWLPDGSLVFATDRGGWWHLHRLFPEGMDSGADLHGPPASEFGRPQWVFGTATWASAGADRLVVSYSRGGRWRLATIDAATRTLRDVSTDLEPLDWLAATPTHAVIVAASPTSAEQVARIDLDTGAAEVLRAASIETLPCRVSVAQALEFPTAGGNTAHAFYYPPASDDYEAPAGDRPPLIVISHGGPTTATRDVLDVKIQYWTSRGFAVVDVNYRGSSGYGRDYRTRLNGQWGIADVEDTIHAARFLAAQGKADPDRLVIRGGSAGGYTTLAALTFHPGVFKAGASYYGICDLEVLAQDTHKFESRYLDSMIGPYPQMRDTYFARSPIHFVDQLACALILFQGLEDKVVPPNQSQMMADAVGAKGLPVELHTFEGEQHGFRKAETIIRCLDAELAFYQRVFGLR